MKKSLAAVILLCVMLVSAGASFARAEEKVSYEEAFGAAVGMALYNAQVVIGMTADSIAKGLYSSEVAMGIIREQNAMLALLKDSYVKQLILSRSTAEADRVSLRKILTSIDMLNETISALRAYIQNQSKSNADNFQARRRASFNAIAELLGLESRQ